MWTNKRGGRERSWSESLQFSAGHAASESQAEPNQVGIQNANGDFHGFPAQSRRG